MILCPACEKEVQPVIEMGGPIPGRMVHRCPACQSVLPQPEMHIAAPQLALVEASVPRPAPGPVRGGPVDILAMAYARREIVMAELEVMSGLEAELTKLNRMILAAEASDTGVATLRPSKRRS